MRLRPPLLLLALFWSAIGVTEAARAQESPLDEWIYEVRAGQFASRTLLAYADGVHVLLPVTDVLDLVELAYAFEDSGVVRSRLEHRRLDLALDPNEMSTTRGERVQPIAPDALAWIGPELFVDARVLGSWLGADCYLDPGELQIIFEPVFELPIGQRILRERDRVALLDVSGDDEPTTRMPTSGKVWEGGVLDWSVAAPEPTALEQSALGARFGGSLYGGSLDTGAYGRVDGVGEERFDFSWHGVWPESRFARQLLLGDLSSSSPHARTVRGIAVGNAPFVRKSRFGMIEITGELEPGWEVEAHRMGQLISFQRADENGRYRFELPLDYGQNPVEIRAFGPHGEMIVLEHAARVDFDRLPAQEFEWGVSSGDCSGDECDVASNVDLRYGLLRDWTVRGGVDLFHRSGVEPLDHPYLSLSGSPHSAWQLRGESVYQAWNSLQLGYEPSARLRASMQWQRFDDELANPLLQTVGERSLLRWSLLTRPRAAWRTFFLHGDLRQRDGQNGDRTNSDFGFSVSRRAWRIRSSWKHGREQLLGTESSRDRLLLRVQRSYLSLLADFDLHHDDDHHFDLGYSHRLGRRARVDFGLRVSPVRDDVLFTIGLVSSSNSATYSSSASRYGDGTFSSQSRAEGSIVYEHETERFHFEPYRSLGRGGVRGSVFLDENGNGRRDPEETGIPGARVSIGPMQVRTDEIGRYHVWHLMPFEDSVVHVDAATIPDPLMVPAYESAAIAIVPNGFATVDIPVISGAEISGVIWLQEADGSRRRLGALPVELVELDSGERTALRAFADGEFYRLGVKPGRYTARLPQHVLDRAGWSVLESAEVKIAPDRMGSRAYVLDIVVQ